MKLVMYVYNKKFRRYGGGHREDLLQEGYIGLINASETFDAGRGYSFSTYATKCIANAMGGYLRRECGAARQHLSLDEIDEEGRDLYSVVASSEFGGGGAEELERREIYAQAVAYLGSRSERIKDIVLNWLEGVSVQELASRYGISKQAIHKTIAKELGVIKNLYNGAKCNKVENKMRVQDLAAENNCSVRTYYRKKKLGLLKGGENFDTKSFNN